MGDRLAAVIARWVKDLKLAEHDQQALEELAEQVRQGTHRLVLPGRGSTVRGIVPIPVKARAKRPKKARRK